MVNDHARARTRGLRAIPLTGLSAGPVRAPLCAFDEALSATHSYEMPWPEPPSFCWDPRPVETNEPLHCEGCGAGPLEESVYSESTGTLCGRCARETYEEAKKDAADYATANVRVVRDPEPYDPALRFAPTREEYALGQKAAYTPNAYHAQLRHCNTNYEALIRGLERGDPVDELFYWAVRSRVDELIAEHTDAAWHADASFVDDVDDVDDIDSE